LGGFSPNILPPRGKVVYPLIKKRGRGPGLKKGVKNIKWGKKPAKTRGEKEVKRKP